MKPLTMAKLRELKSALELPLDDEELAQLRPMVEDLLAVARRLRHYQVDVVSELGPQAGPTASPG
jgi:hypothetical protein